MTKVDTVIQVDGKYYGPQEIRSLEGRVSDLEREIQKLRKEKYQLEKKVNNATWDEGKYNRLKEALTDVMSDYIEDQVEIHRRDYPHG